MVATEVGKSGLTLLFAGTSTRVPDFTALGTGSGAGTINSTALVTEVRRTAYTTRDVTVQKKVTYTTDFDAVTMSGTATLKEFGMFASGAGAADTLYSIEAFANNAIAFDGSNELQVQVEYTVY